MGLGDLWSRTLVYFGIAEEDEDWDDNGYVTEEDVERSYRERPNSTEPIRTSVAPSSTATR